MKFVVVFQDKRKSIVITLLHIQGFTHTLSVKLIVMEDISDAGRKDRNLESRVKVLKFVIIIDCRTTNKVVFKNLYIFDRNFLFELEDSVCFAFFLWLIFFYLKLLS